MNPFGVSCETGCDSYVWASTGDGTGEGRDKLRVLPCAVFLGLFGCMKQWRENVECVFLLLSQPFKQKFSPPPPCMRTQYTGRMGWMAHRKWKEAKQLPGTAGPGNILGCCLISSHFLWAIHPIGPVLKLCVAKFWGSRFRVCRAAAR